VEQAVEREEVHLALERMADLPRLPGRRVRRDDDLAELRVGVRLPRERERHHVGGALAPEEAPVQVHDFGVVHDRQGDGRVRAGPVEGEGEEPAQARPVDGAALAVRESHGVAGHGSLRIGLRQDPKSRPENQNAARARCFFTAENAENPPSGSERISPS
jgi:hypothetical protein